MKTNVALLTTLLAAGAFASPAFVPGHVVHDKRDTLTGDWMKRHALPGNTRVPLTIALKQRNIEEGSKLLFEISDPKSNKYAQYLTQKQVSEFFAPGDDSVDKVVQWLKDEGIPASHITVSKSKTSIKADVTASQLEDLLKTRYHAYRHVQSRRDHVGTDSYHLPREVSELVDFISPSTVFAPQAGRKRSNQDFSIVGNKMKPVPHALAEATTQAASTDNCDTQITPACILAMYNIPAASDSVDPSNTLGIFETSDQTYLQSDLDAFYEAAGVDIDAGTAPEANLIDGAGAANDPSGTAGGEITLDLDIAIPIVYPQTVTLFQTVVNEDDIFNTFLDAVDGSYCSYLGGDSPSVDGTTDDEQCGDFTPPNVVSFSYGWDEASYPASYMVRQCNEFMKLGLQGVTLVFSSGDDGVARRGGPCLGSKRNIFTPNTAASCPYVTTVGATTLPSGSSVGDAETAVTSFSSGGGFSNVFTTPSYQADAVNNYLTNHNPGYKSYTTVNGTIPTNGGIYNAGGRGFPDLSAVGDNGLVVVGGQQGLSGGTSMAAPLVAAIFNRINEERIAAGKSTIGFVNPTLYQNPSMFNDITVGNQAKGGPNGDGAASACGNKGFSAVAGWDPVTGLGTPKYDAMLEVFMAL